MLFCLQNWAKFMAYIFMILPELGRIWSSSNVTAGLACLGQLLGAVPRWWPCIRHAGSGCKIGYYGGVVFIICVLVVSWPVFAVMQAVVYAYGIWLSSGCQIRWLGFK